MIRMKWLIGLIFVMLVMGGCSEEAISNDFDPEKQYNIELMMWGSSYDLDAVNAQLELMKTVYQNITVDVTYIPDGYGEKLATMFAAKDTPDIIMMAEEIHTLTSMDLVIPLNDFMDAAGLKVEERFGKSYEIYGDQGVQYGLPIQTTGLMLFYNQDMFDKKGLAYPNKSWNWGDLEKAAVELTDISSENPDQSIYGFTPGTWWPIWVSMMYQNGGRILNDDEAVVIESKENSEALNFFVNFMHGENKVTPTKQDYQNMGNVNESGLFAQGRSAMMVGAWWNLQALDESCDFKWNIAPLFHNKENAAMFFSSAYTISKYANERGAAFKVIDYLTDYDAQKVLLDEKTYIPANVKVLENEFSKYIWTKNDDFNINAIYETEEQYVMVPTGPYFFEMMDIISQEMELTFINPDNVSVDEALGNIQVKLDALMTKYQEK